MCGIVGMLSFDKNVKREKLKKMCDAISYRGPENRSIWISNDNLIGFGHQRLSIIDLENNANQPMLNRDKSVALVFNGEIYNAVELRRELENSGHRFITKKSDTEVIIHAYEQWGIDCIKRFSGMFALAIWDANKRKLFIARDRIGIKPLYYTMDSKRLIFASEIKSIFANDDVKKVIRSEAIYDYLTFLTVSAPNTMYEKIYKLEAGQLMIVESDGSIRKEIYWNAADYLNNPLSEKYEDAFYNTKNILEKTIDLYSISDVGSFVTLSSGVDSNLVAAMMKERKNDIQAITVDYEVKSKYSECSNTLKMAKQLGIEDVDILKISTKDFISHAEEYMISQNDYPVGAQDIIIFSMLFNKIKDKNSKVCILGEGADEIGGYPSYITMNDEYKELSEFNKLPQSIKEQIFLNSSLEKQNKLEVAMGSGVISRKHIQSFTESEKKKLWCNDKVRSSYLVLEKYMNEITVDSEDQFIRKIQNVEFKFRLPEFMLPRVDYPSMFNSIEARVPFLEHKLVEYILRVDRNIIMKNNMPKSLFKDLLSNYLSTEDVYRKKLGFGRVLSPLLKDYLPKITESQIYNKKNHEIFNYINRNYLLELLEEHYRKGENGFKLWTIFSLAKWLESQ